MALLPPPPSDSHTRRSQGFGAAALKPSCGEPAPHGLLLGKYPSWAPRSSALRTARPPRVPALGYRQRFREAWAPSGQGLYKPRTGIQTLSRTVLGMAYRAGPFSHISVGSGGNIKPSPTVKTVK